MSRMKTFYVSKRFRNLLNHISHPLLIKSNILEANYLYLCKKQHFFHFTSN